ncbi:MAG: methylated-DNA--[protein]-cysteine S-methyltransferase [Gammaproteobacteria bacterium]|nr:methylated-DNA--[protein]-cysteine S-methyltransferase [Gammaproteobacteria bacterium]
MNSPLSSRPESGSVNSQVSSTIETPLGRLTITASKQGIAAIGFTEQDCPFYMGNPMTASPVLPKAILTSDLNRVTPPEAESAKTVDVSPSAEQHLQQTVEQLLEYFAGSRQQFSLTLAPVGSFFQQRVWQALCAIPYAQSCSYGAIATQLQNPKAVRAVGAANGRNPIAIVVPCHRVIGANGRLTGYAGGLNRKLWLLEHELKHQKP